MKDRIDKILYKKSKEDIDIPSKLPEMIIRTIDDVYFKEEKYEKVNKKSNTIFLKFVTGLCACFLLTTTVVFAKEIIESIFKLSKEYYGQQSLQKAIEENYVQANESNEYIKSKNGILYKFNHVVLNDINLILSLDFVFQDALEEYQGMTMNGLVITDENNNLIYKDGIDQEIIENNIATYMTNHTVEKNNNTLQESIILLSAKFPDIEKLYVSFDSIILYNVENGIAKTKTIEENYNIEIPINEKFKDRNVIYYKVRNESNNEIKIEDVKLTNTGLGIIVKGKEIEGFGYKFKIFDMNNKEIYSKTNIISQYENMNKYFVWLDVDENFNEDNNFRIEITDTKEEKYYFYIEEGVG